MLALKGQVNKSAVRDLILSYAIDAPPVKVMVKYS
jgi:hypothetical protein